MTETLKKYLALTVMLTLLVFAYAAVHYVLAYAKASQPSSYRSFSVSGQGSATAVPDVAQFSFGVVTQGGIDLAVTQEENTKKANGTIAFLKEQGIEEKDITTKSYGVEPRYQYHSCPEGGGVCPPSDIVGYTVRQQVHVKVRDFGILGGLLSGVVENGANTVSQLSFTVDDPTQAQNEARKEAIKKAMAKARATAEAGGFTVGRLLSFQEGSVVPVPLYEYALEAAGRGGVAPAPSIEPGSQEIEVNVTLEYEIR
ncbi:MAG: hypothetical protein A3B10_04565 [Candidatus Doudnabacteria bacterium RIFCSPLOWO2_01_FULL_44_21]|uniref:26 kDa periplasmic immunogenic protein n=2 Tax=Bacteria candidate phyla TaxID=1783234 RepID=A0A1G2QYN8_9BACT|nr:MAG: hypothetical protein A3B10_04565 [Candidatus Doudnabacteria bacterium RIFCSPLOWO2_01_FULL_44_21]OHA65102.1 MAG: hypothetical protein A2672_01380 [Candidatus Wildermuthbacteria bacterium RIFCSPHIGHO2_01_FULL_49_22b]